MTKVIAFHYFKLILRSVLLIGTLFWYITTKTANGEVSLRHHLHPVFLPVSVMVSEEQMLQHLPDL